MNHLVLRVDLHAGHLWGYDLVSLYSKHDYTNQHTIHGHPPTYCKGRSHSDLQSQQDNGRNFVPPNDLQAGCFPKGIFCLLILRVLLFLVQLRLSLIHI